MAVNLQKAEFILSAASPKDFLRDGLPQIAFAGRSNVGKSSVINRLLNRKNFARVGAAPGKTTHINYFKIDNAFYLVDLPGYGYAKVSNEIKAKWGKMIERYLHELKEYGIDSLILGCTHYPLIRNAIGRYMGPEVTLVNPAYETAKSLKVMLAEQKLLNQSGELARYEYYVSDGVDKFSTFADRVLPCDVERAKVVDIESY